MIAQFAKRKKRRNPLVFKLDSKKKKDERSENIEKNAKFCEKKKRSDDIEQAP